MEKTITETIMEKAIELCLIADTEERLFGSSYVEIGERSIIIIDPTKVNLSFDKKGKLNKVYGVSLIHPDAITKI